MKILEIPIKKIVVTENHRTNIGETHLDELMNSMRQNGLEQPIGLAEYGAGKYQLVFGHRRLLAAEKLGWKTITAQIRPAIKDKEHLILNLTENLQRKDPSFPELGRAIGRLEKMKLTMAEISARLGIPLNKVRSIYRAYESLPAKHRNKVKYAGKPGARTKDGTLPPNVATAIIRVKKSHGLSDKACDHLVKYASEGGMGSDELVILSQLMESGMPFSQAKEKMMGYKVYRVDVIANKFEVGERMEEIGVPSSQQVLKKIIYGELPALKKPDFVTTIGDKKK